MLGDKPRQLPEPMNLQAPPDPRHVIQSDYREGMSTDILMMIRRDLDKLPMMSLEQETRYKRITQILRKRGVKIN